MSTVLPGHVLSDAPSRIGPGLYASGNPPIITALRAGRLYYTHGKQHTHKTSKHARDTEDASADAMDIDVLPAEKLVNTKSTAYVDASTKRYVPANNDAVIGTITARFADGYRVHLGSALTATLDSLAFENVNRKSRPNLAVGDTIYAKTSNVLSSAECDVACVNESGKSAGLGVLTGGFMAHVSLGLCRRLLSASDVVLSSIGARIEYEVIVGLNGKIWVSAESKKMVLIIVQIIKDVEFLSEGEARTLIAQRLKSL